MKSGISANQLWTQQPVANRLVEVNTKTGFTAAVSDKTGFSLTAASYVVRASSTQTASVGTAANTSVTSTISSVTTTRALACWQGTSATDTGGDETAYLHRVVLAGATSVNIIKGVTANNTPTVTFNVIEIL